MDKQALEYVTPSFDEVDPFAAEQKAAEDKYLQLEQAKQDKLANLSIKNQASLDQDSFTQTDDGYLLSNKNKIYNDLYSGDLNFIFDEVKNQELAQNKDGQWGRFSKDETGAEVFTPYEGSVRRVYGYNTDQGGFKLGLARGDLPTSDFRYIPGAAEEAGLSVGPNGYGWKPGPEGLNLDKKVLDIVVPYETATAFEGLVHGNKNALNQRLNMFKDMEERDAARERFGSGASEYYKSQEALFDPQYRRKSDEELRSYLKAQTELPQVANPWEGYSEFNEEGIRVRNRDKMTEEERAAERRLLSQIRTEEGTVMARAGNMVDALQRTLYKEAVLDFADWTGEGLEYLTDGAIGWDYGTEEEKTQWVNETFGFRPELANAAYQEAEGYAKNIAEGLFNENKDVAFEDIYELVKIGITTPEMLGDSIGFIGSFFIPIAGWGGKAAKVDKTIKSINAAKKAGALTEDAAKVAIAAEKANLNTLNKLRKFTQANAGLMQVAAGNVNDQIDAYREEFDEAPSIAKVGQMFALETMMLGLDRFVDLSILKAPKALQGYKEAFSVLEPTGKAKVLAKAVGVAGGLAVSMGKEAGQEYLQEIGQEFNVKFNFDQTGSFTEALDEAGNVLLDKDLQTKGIMGAGLGAGGAVQFEALGSVGTLGKAAIKGGAKLKEVTQEALKPKTATTDVESVEVAKELDEVIAAAGEASKQAKTAAGSYYNGVNSSNPEVAEQSKVQAQQALKTIQDGTNSTFSSDEEFSVRVEKFKEQVEIAVAENPKATVEEIKRSALKGFKAENNPEQAAQVEEAVDAGYAAGLEFASLKPMKETSKEVRNGPRGFLTYYALAKAALAEGDTAGYETNIEKLDTFYTHQTVKLERLKAGAADVRAIIETQVDNLVKQGKAKTRNEALSMIEKASGNKTAKIRISDKAPKPFKIKYDHVIANMKNPNDNIGVYSLIQEVENETTTMGKVFSRVVGKEVDTPSSTTPPSSTVEPTTTSEVSSGPTAMTEEEFEKADTAADMSTENELEALMEEELNENVSVEEIVDTVEEPKTEAVSSAVEGMSDEEINRLEELDSLEELAALEEDTSENVDFDEFESLMNEDTDTSVPGQEEVSEVPVKDDTVKAYNENRKSIKEVQKRITERRAELRAQGVTTLEEVLKDEEMASLFAEKDRLTKEQETSFVNQLKDTFEKRVKSFTSRSLPAFKFLSYANRTKTEIKTAIDKLVSSFKPTGFTLSKRTRNNATKLTKRFADNLLASMNVTDGEFNVGLGNNFTQNPITAFLFDENGKLNYNTVEAMQAASYEFLVQEASNLLGANRDSQEIADLFGISSEEVTPEMFQEFANGGMIYKLAAPSIGEKLINHLGLQVEGVQNKEALATAFGMAALRALEGDFIEISSYSEPGVLYGEVDYVKGLPSMYNTFPERNVPNLYDARQQLNTFEETLGVELDKGRTYRRTKTKGKRKVYIHKSQYQEAPKDHQEVVNRLENTAFSFNSGNDVLLELFGNEEKALDVNKIVERILGSEKDITNRDARDRYEAQKAALMRDIQFFQDAKDDVGSGSLFFNWFIAKNQRIHLDSNRVNPQNDKNLARWLLTTNNSRPIIKKSEVQAVLKGKSADKEAMMFVYGIVQAFDGAKDIPGVDKNNQTEVVAAAKKLLEDTTDAQLLEMTKDVDHLGHAALAIANIRKYMDNDTSFESDMVLEVDGLTNGFAFRAMQFPLGQKIYQWLEKVGVIRASSEFYSLSSMNGARDMNQEDVYISVGSVFQDKIIEAKDSLDDVSGKWINLFEEFGKLPNFSDKDDASVKKFVRNLMKSPVMIFNYAAGKEKIAGGLVNDQVMGTGYLSGRGLVDALTEVDSDKNYVITKAKLVEVFGKDLGEKYHKAREALAVESIGTKKNNSIIALRADLTKAVGILYKVPLEDTLESLFADQTEVNKVITEAGQFMFAYFKENYDVWRKANPTATEEEKTEYLRNIAQVVPGVAGASTDDQLTKVTFLKSILEPTNNYVLTNIGGKKTGTNTISKSYGDPGVGPAVLLVLSSDSSTLAKTLNQTYKGKEGFGALPVHDAMVLGANEFSAISAYNMNFYSVNRNYSIMQEFVSAIEGLENLDGKVKYKKVYNKATRKSRSFAEMKTDLVATNRRVQEARKELFDNELKVGQMSGPEGSMVVVNPEQVKDVAKKVVAKASETLLSRFKEKRIQKALGKDYAKALARIEKMLEGCK
jgi:hypothetical protein